jgi:hypothetical protein
MAKVAGTAFVKIDGQQVALRGNFKIKPSGVQRESIVGLDGYHGYKETPTVPGFEMDVTDRPEVSIKKLANLTNVTIVAELINGKNYILRNAVQMAEIELNADDGTFTLHFESPEMEERTA